MAAPPALVLVYLLIGLLSINRFSHVVLGKRREFAVFAVASTAVVMVVPVWSKAPTWSVATAASVVAVWTVVREIVTLFKENTKVASLVLIAALAIIWLVAYAIDGSPDWITSLGATGAALGLVIVHMLILRKK